MTSGNKTVHTTPPIQIWGDCRFLQVNGTAAKHYMDGGWEGKLHFPLTPEMPFWVKCLN